MKTLTKADLKVGDYYHCTEPGSWYILFKVTNLLLSGKGKDNDRIKAHYIEPGKNGYYHNTPWVSGRTMRLATEEETAHIDACIIAGRYIHSSAIPKTNTYSVFN